MRHRMRGRTLGRSPSHRRALLRNLACHLIRSVRVDPDDEKKPKVPGRIVTTLPKAKELRPFVEKLVTLACKAAEHESRAHEFASSAERGSDEWQRWRESNQWNQWNQAIAPAVAMRRRAFSQLRDNQAVDILFDEIASKFSDRPGGYTRIVRLADVRLGDGAQKALIEFVGERDRVKSTRRAPLATDEEASEAEAESVTAESKPGGDTETHEGEEQTESAEGAANEGDAAEAEAGSTETDKEKSNESGPSSE